MADRYRAYNLAKEPGYSGMGTTLSANPLQFAAMRATLEEVMTAKNYAHMERLAARLEAGLAAADRNDIGCPGMSPGSARASSSSARRARCGMAARPKPRTRPNWRRRSMSRWSIAAC